MANFNTIVMRAARSLGCIASGNASDGDDGRKRWTGRLFVGEHAASARVIPIQLTLAADHITLDRVLNMLRDGLAQVRTMPNNDHRPPVMFHDEIGTTLTAKQWTKLMELREAYDREKERLTGNSDVMRGVPLDEK